jgi:hypothetical protein
MYLVLLRSNLLIAEIYYTDDRSREASDLSWVCLITARVLHLINTQFGIILSPVLPKTKLRRGPKKPPSEVWLWCHLTTSQNS